MLTPPPFLAKTYVSSRHLHAEAAIVSALPPPPPHTQVFPKQLLLSLLPPELDILCTHPMFGPDSGKGSWAGLNFMYDPVRVGDDPKRQQRLDLFLNFFRTQGCRCGSDALGGGQGCILWCILWCIWLLVVGARGALIKCNNLRRGGCVSTPNRD
jgi:hypothetical protein